MTARAKWAVAVSTVLLWAIGCFLYCYWYIASILATPGFDAYAYSAGFQFLMFVIFRLPFLILALFLILFAEALICNLLFDKKEN